MSYGQLHSGPVGLAQALVIVPTQLEAEALRPLPVTVGSFGLVDAGIAAMRLLEDRRPTMCVLVGLGGSLDLERAPLGSVVEATGFQCYGIGAGAEPDLETTEEMGLPDGCEGMLTPRSYETSTGSLELPGLRRGEFLSVCAASAHLGQAKVRASRFSRAIVEEMEGYAVARAARLLGVPFAAMRGISNIAGDRDRDNWRVEAAFSALHSAVERLLEALP